MGKFLSKKTLLGYIGVFLFFLFISLGISFLNSKLFPKKTLISDFQGEYYQGDGLGVNFSLTINPNMTFLFYGVTDLLLEESYTGKIIVSGNEFQLDSAETFLFEPKNLFPVKWGKRRYLIGTEEIGNFCEYVNKNWEPRSEIRGLAYLRRTDLSLPVEGQPLLLDGTPICP